MEEDSESTSGTVSSSGRAASKEFGVLPPRNRSTDFPDLEKAETQPDTRDAVTTGATDARVTRIQSLTRKRTRDGRFNHSLAHSKTTEESIVDFNGPDDLYHPLNWPMRKKVVTTALYGLTTMGSTLASSIVSPFTDVVAQEYGVSRTVSLLATSLLILGFGLGPICWAPLSEVYGRKPAVLLPVFIASMFSFATAASKDIQSVLITRFFTGW
jgi:hypothetical protein